MSTPVVGGIRPPGDSLSGSTGTDGANLITIPANRTWVGYLNLSASLSAAASAVTATPVLGTTFAAGNQPSGAFLLQLTLTTPAEATAASSVASCAVIQNLELTAGPSGMSVFLTVNNATKAQGIAVGYLV